VCACAFAYFIFLGTFDHPVEGPTNYSWISSALLCVQCFLYSVRNSECDFFVLSLEFDAIN